MLTASYFARCFIGLQQHGIPGKEEFHETIRYFRNRLDLAGVNMRLNTTVTAEDLMAQGFDSVILATGIEPRKLNIPGSDHPKVRSPHTSLRPTFRFSPSPC